MKNNQPVDIMANAFNKKQSRSEQKFKLWRSVGIMLTYKCPAACGCCYVFSAPDISCSGEISAELAYDCWKSTVELTGDSGSVHLTGGEPFLRFELLENLLKQAKNDQISNSLEKIETNAAWCVDDKITTDRISRLAELGLTKLQISTDIYHQQYVPTENLQRAIRIATDILGPEKLQVRWRDFAENPVHSENMSAEQLDEAFRDALAKIPERMVGRAAEVLAPLVEQKPFEAFEGINCLKGHMGAKGVHIDGWGNVFSSTCIGIITGKVTEQYSLKQLWLNYDFTKHPIWSILTDSGAYGLALIAQDLGFIPEKTYAGKCHLCYSVRKWLFENGHFPDCLGPGICYGQS